jgi:hypothetical protein
MRVKTKYIIGEICFLVLLSLVIYRYAFKLCWETIDYYQFDDDTVSSFSFIFLFLWGLGIVFLPVKNVYIKIALIYPAILVFACIWGMPFFMSLVPA